MDAKGYSNVESKSVQNINNKIIKCRDIDYIIEKHLNSNIILQLYKNYIWGAGKYEKWIN